MSPTSREILDALLACEREQIPTALATVVSAPPSMEALIGRKKVIWLDRPSLGDLGLGELEAQVVESAREAIASRRHHLARLAVSNGHVEVFIEVQQRPLDLIIVGAGHIAQPLCQIGAMCDFRVTVIDDRPQYARRDRFPQAAEVIAAPMAETLREWLGQGRLGPDTYVVLVTRGHQHDIDCLLEILDAPLAYIGMIGSRRRVTAVFQLLSEEKGIPAAKFDRVHAPIGLDIGAHTPAEIAVSIMAEIIKVRRGGTGISLSEQRRRRAMTTGSSGRA